eukprot:2425020-Prymnesium_polylepis.1
MSGTAGAYAGTGAGARDEAPRRGTRHEGPVRQASHCVRRPQRPGEKNTHVPPRLREAGWRVGIVSAHTAAGAVGFGGFGVFGSSRVCVCVLRVYGAADANRVCVCYGTYGSTHYGDVCHTSHRALWPKSMDQ